MLENSITGLNSIFNNKTVYIIIAYNHLFQYKINGDHMSPHLTSLTSMAYTIKSPSCCRLTLAEICTSKLAKSASFSTLSGTYCYERIIQT